MRTRLATRLELNLHLAAALALCLAAAPALAQAQKAVPASQALVQLSLAPVVKRAQPAVVNVYASRVEAAPRNPLFDDPMFRQFFGGEGDNSRVSQSLGSGVIVDADGLIITNEHVIAGMTEVKVALADKREFPAEIVLREHGADLAVLRIKADEKLPTLELGDSDALEVGDFVVAIGNPFGVGQTVTQGIISALARSQAGIGDYGFFLQTDAAINPGNSGGALVGMDGKLVGVNSAIYSRSGGSMGIGFAIPANMVKGVVAAARGGGRSVKRPWLGAELRTVSPDIAESMGLSRPAGAIVAALAPNSPAASAGLKAGDLISAIDGHPVDDAAGVGFQLATKATGGQAKLEVLRAGKPFSVALALAPPPEIPPREKTRINARSLFSGAEVMNLSPAVLDELSMREPAAGVVVSDVAEGSPAAEVGLRKGDVVIAVNGEKISATRDLERVAGRKARVWDVTVSRDGQVIRSQLGG